ncbi:PoNe immunity protein domain-containing protein, partial [Pseudomonas sp. NPDC096917]|uniref:PoNe immunity protein domain-containing protein n=1 Tax=Pseudomonas sp. NPDC096917 TaxID=3364483 RepID=UPI00383A5DA5
MSYFDQVKRDPWMTEQHYQTSTAAKEAEFADRDISDLLTDPLRDARHNKGLSWDHAYMALELAIQRYSGGAPLELVDTYVDYAFIQFQRYFDAYPTVDARLRPWVRDEYQYILWMLALAVLFGY